MLIHHVSILVKKLFVCMAEYKGYKLEVLNRPFGF